MKDELDERTLDEAVRGDATARLALVRRYEVLVLTMVTRVVGASSSDRFDLAQESFVRALLNLSRFDRSRGVRFSTWISTIAVRVAIDHVRRRGRVVSLDTLRASGRAPEEEVADADETGLDDKREAERLRRAMLELSPEHRAILVLRFEAELSLEEIARELELELGTVKSRLSRARDALRSAVRGAARRAEGT